MNNILFFGTYQHKVDSKGRVSIPAEWRKHLNGFCFAHKTIYKVNGLEFNFYPSLDKIDTQDLQYFFKYNLDKTGRICIDKTNCIAILKGYNDYFTIEFKS